MLRSHADILRCALRAAVLVALGGHSAVLPACSTEANTISLLDETDGGKKPEPEPTSCSGDDDCTGSLPFCNPADHRCVECLSATQCPTAYRCAAETHTCEPPCRSSNECSGIDRPICSGAGVCVQCAGDADCASTPATLHCNLSNGLCVQCVVQADCGRSVCFDDCYVCTNNACVWRT